MPHLNLNLEALFSEKLLELVPHSEKNLEENIQEWKNWTGLQKKENAPYSGYRFHSFKPEILNKSLSLAKELRESFECMIVIGIGGSALGAQAALESLEHTVEDKRKIIFIDNLDPLLLQKTLQDIPWEKTCLTAISKSGSTIECIGALALFLEEFKKRKLSFSKHILAITDPVKSLLKDWATRENCPILPLESTVGGRFSVFTPVGQLPLAFFGINIQALIEGAQEHFQSFEIQKTAKLAHRLYELDKGGYSLHGLFVYSTYLKNLGAWFLQLWGESLGKTDAQGLAQGSFPFSAVGSTDQHSILQYLMEGKQLSTLGFIKVTKNPETLKIPAFPKEFQKALSYAENQSYLKIVSSQAQATEEALNKAGKASYSIEINALSPKNIGALFAFYMDLTALTGSYYKIDPFDQPGVELGKLILKKIFLK